MSDIVKQGKIKLEDNTYTNAVSLGATADNIYFELSNESLEDVNYKNMQAIKALQEKDKILNNQNVVLQQEDVKINENITEIQENHNKKDEEYQEDLDVVSAQISELQTDNITLEDRMTEVETKQTAQKEQLTEIKELYNKMTTPLPTTIKTGTDLILDNSTEFINKQFNIYGNQEQKTTQGLNIFNPKVTTSTKTGVTVSPVGKYRIKINGENSSAHRFVFDEIPELEKDSVYTITIKKISGTLTNCSPNRTWSFLFYPDSSANSFIRFSATSTIESKTITATDSNIAPYFWFAWETESVEGTDGVFKNLVLEISIVKGETALEYEDYTGGQPSPSLDYPQTVETVKNSVEIIKRNKNQFDIEEQTRTNNGITTTYKEGKFSLTGTATTNWASITNANTPFNLKTGKYTISVCNFTPTENYSLEFTLKHSDNTYTKWYLDKYNTSRTYILDKDVISITMGLSKFKAGDTLNLEFPIQLVSGDTLDDFINPQSETYTLPVQQEMLEGDYIDDVEHHEWAKQILDGSEDWNLNTQYENTFYNRVSNTVFPGITEDKDCFTLISDKLIWGGIVTSSSGFKDGYMYGFLRGDSGKIFKRINFKSTKFSTVDELKTYLASNPITVYYKLATPTDLSLTDEQKEVVEKIKRCEFYDNSTYIYNGTSIPTQLEVEYFNPSDLLSAIKPYVNTLIKKEEK